jgi:hypothetical protein
MLEVEPVPAHQAMLVQMEILVMLVMLVIQDHQVTLVQ